LLQKLLSIQNTEVKNTKTKEGGKTDNRKSNTTLKKTKEKEKKTWISKLK
jgi:hypothetical protein